MAFLAASRRTAVPAFREPVLRALDRHLDPGGRWFLSLLELYGGEGIVDHVLQDMAKRALAATAPVQPPPTASAARAPLLAGLQRLAANRTQPTELLGHALRLWLDPPHGGAPTAGAALAQAAPDPRRQPAIQQYRGFFRWMVEGHLAEQVAAGEAPRLLRVVHGLELLLGLEAKAEWIVRQKFQILMVPPDPWCPVE